MRNVTLALIIAIGVMGGFYSGFKFEQSKAGSSASGSPSTPTALAAGGAGAGGAGTGSTGSGTTGAGNAGAGAAGAGGGFGGRGTFGSVVSLSGSTLTIKDAQGNDVKVQLQGSTTISKTVSAQSSDLSQGVNVTVAGQRNSDGSVNATAITIVPAGAAFAGGGGGGRGAPSPATGG